MTTPKNIADHGWLANDNLSDAAPNIAYWLDQQATPGGETFTADTVTTVPVTVNGFSAAQTGNLLNINQVTSGSVLLQVKTVASAVNGVTVTAAATGVSPTLAAVGETNVGLKVNPKGTGSVVVTAGAVAGVPVEVDGAGTTQTGSLLVVKQVTAGNTLFEVATVTTAATGLKITSAAAASGVALAATSSGTDESFTVDAKGAGVVKLATVSTGGIQIGKIADATNVALGTSTGTKIGTATSQKLAFFNSTPIIQPSITGALSTVADAPAKAVLTSIIGALKATTGLGLAADGTT